MNAEALPQADVVIVLGGFGADFNNSANRLMHALQIYRTGKAKRILISGNGDHEEAGVHYLVKLGFPRSAVMMETMSRSTRENAVNCAKIFEANGWRVGLLVTSGIHMPRAVAAFYKVGLTVSPAAASPERALGRNGARVDLQVSKLAMLRTSAAMKELFAFLVYKCLGWA